jgi:hypothetical protein
MFIEKYISIKIEGKCEKIKEYYFAFYYHFPKTKIQKYI